VSRAIVQEDGTFRLVYEARGANDAEDGALTGPHRVTFISPMTEPPKWSPQDDWLPEEEKARLKEQRANAKVYPELPCGIALTPGEVEVLDGENNFEFTLEAEPTAAPRSVQPPSGSD
jgi:hypothetical protein